MSEQSFIHRHIGPRNHEINEMLSQLNVKSIEELINQTVPEKIRLRTPLNLPAAITEQEYALVINEIASKNKIYKTYIGLGFYGVVLPAVIQRNILENPSWYTSYTPYQAEISQGRLEALFNFQTVITELTGMEIANASLLDEASASAEAMIMMYNLRSKEAVKKGVCKFLVSPDVFPQNLAVINNHADPQGIEVVVAHINEINDFENYFGAIYQYPTVSGEIVDYSSTIQTLHSHNILVCFVADILSLSLLKSPASFDVDIVVGSTQRLGIPMSFGGPHAAYFATRDAFKRSLPGRIIGISIDRREKPAFRMALQTREQHIKREKATSNICTAQALLAIMAGMYVVYHGAKGLKLIAQNIHQLTNTLVDHLAELGFKIKNTNYFGTIEVELPNAIHATQIETIALEKEINFFYKNQQTISISIDETTSVADLNNILEVFAIAARSRFRRVQDIEQGVRIASTLLRTDNFLTQDIFTAYHSETELMRYIKRLEKKDISLTDSMISLGSCTMKLNAAMEMIPISKPEFCNIHPFVPLEQSEGFHEMIFQLGKYLKEITGFSGISFQPNSGATGEYSGLMVIRAYHQKNNQAHRNVVLIPASAHGTNPASAAMAGMQVVVVSCDENGNIDLNSLKTLAQEHKDKLAAYMVTYPSTHGVFEEEIMEMSNIIHQYGGQVYMDGANLNAQLGLTKPALIGADVCHLNLHKTFAIPHGGGGPGVGPIAVAEHLIEFLPTHPLSQTGGSNGIQPVAASPYGSAGVLPISFGYCMMAGGDGLKLSAMMAIINANYIASKLSAYYKILFTNDKGRVAHEMILDCRPLKASSGISETDIAKRLIDYGFHAPTLSFPVAGTLMIEPTESESKSELDRFIDAMISIYQEIKEVENGTADKEDNVLVNAPHTAQELIDDNWNHPYSRAQAAYPKEWLIDRKYWAPVSRVNNAYGDRNLVCTCQ